MCLSSELEIENRRRRHFFLLLQKFVLTLQKGLGAKESLALKKSITFFLFQHAKIKIESIKSHWDDAFFDMVALEGFYLDDMGCSIKWNAGWGSDGYEPLQARALLELARKIGCSKVARLENSSKKSCSKNARLEIGSIKSGSKIARLEIDRVKIEKVIFFVHF